MIDNWDATMNQAKATIATQAQLNRHIHSFRRNP